MLQRRAALELLAGNPRNALTLAREALATIDPLASAEPQNPLTARVLCEVLLTAADADPPNATSLRTRAAAVAAAHGKRDPRIAALRARAVAALQQPPGA